MTGQWVRRVEEAQPDTMLEAVMGFTEVISIVGQSIEAMGVFVIVAGIAVSTFQLLKTFRLHGEGVVYSIFRRQLGRSTILGLEFLIAGDIIRTIVVTGTLLNIMMLGLIILIRSFLIVTLHLEVEGRWPWQAEKYDGG